MSPLSPAPFFSLLPSPPSCSPSPPPFSPISPSSSPSESQNQPESSQPPPTENPQLSPSEASQEAASVLPPGWFGFKIVGDNVDKTVKPRHETMHQHSQSLHYFHAYAVRDRIDFSFLSAEPSQLDPSLYLAEMLLPSSEELDGITKSFSILIARILAKHVPEFVDFQDAVVDHIPHKYSCEMEQKSNVVPLGVLLKNENIIIEDMASIMESLQNYVPHVRKTTSVPVPGKSGEYEQVHHDFFQHILFGGDQLTKVRAEGAQRMRSNSPEDIDKLIGLVPVIEDWHAKQCLAGVFWKRLYRKSSSMDGGTLHQLRNLINRRNLPSKPKQDLNACEDFMEVVGIGHIIAAAKELLQNESIDPSNMTSEQKNDKIHEFARKIVSKHVNLHLVGEDSMGTSDSVLDYAREVLTLSMLYAEFHDAIREADGFRIIRCWKFLLIVFKASNRKNYALTALHLLAQYHILLPPRLAQQLIWSRCVNTVGKPGCNIPMDLHMEHLNRTCKTAIANLKANVTPKAVVRIGKCLGPLTGLINSFSRASSVTPNSSSHSEARFNDDLNKIVSELEKSGVFKLNPGRKHTAFQKFHGSLTDKINKGDMIDYIENKLKKFKIPCA